LATVELKNPLEVTDKNLEQGKELYTIYCGICHGDKGGGQGILVKREKFFLKKLNLDRSSISITLLSKIIDL
jgi:hypothetical protein